MAAGANHWADGFVAKKEKLGTDGAEVPSFHVPAEALARPRPPDGPVTAQDLLDLNTAKVEARVAGHCEGVPRPCPFVSCKHNLYLDVEPGTGEVRFNFPLLEPEDMPPEASCAIDVARSGARDDAAVAELLNVGEAVVERVVRVNGPKLREALSEFREHSCAAEQPATPLGTLASAMQGGVERGLAEDEEDRSGRVLPDRLYMHLYPEHHELYKRGVKEANVDDDEYQRALWKVYERASRQHCEDLAEQQASAAKAKHGDKRRGSRTRDPENR